MLKLGVIFLLLILLLGGNGCFANTIVIKDVTDLNSVLKYIESENPDLGSTLVVLDIDDTLLQSINFVGSVKWYNWQRGRAVFDAQGNAISIEHKDKFHCMFGTLGTLFELGTATLTQPDVAQVVNQLKVYDLMILTARTTDYRGPTERELAINGISLVDEHLMKSDIALIYQLNDNKRTAKVTYHNGIVMSSGLNKGMVLKSILERVGASYNYIYFVDDSRKNIDNMKNAWQQDKTKLRLFHYTRVDRTITQDEITQSREAKRLFDAFLKTTFPDRSKTFSSGQCR